MPEAPHSVKRKYCYLMQFSSLAAPKLVISHLSFDNFRCWQPHSTWHFRFSVIIARSCLLYHLWNSTSASTTRLPRYLSSFRMMGKCQTSCDLTIWCLTCLPLNWFWFYTKSSHILFGLLYLGCYLHFSKCFWNDFVLSAPGVLPSLPAIRRQLSLKAVNVRGTGHHVSL